MRYTVLTLFPEISDTYFSSSIMAKALERGIIEYRAINIRDYALDKHHSCDDAPYGGGAGMLMLAEPLGRALEAAGAVSRDLCAPDSGDGEANYGSMAKYLDTSTLVDKPRVIYLSPGGRPFDQALARELAGEKELVLVCGRYEGIDQRIVDAYVDDEISVGDYVLSSGEVAALILIDATYRLVERVITPASLDEESHSGGLLEYPQYTRPEIYGTMRVPEVLLSGHHENIRRWRLEKRVEKTLAVRPDLVQKGISTVYNDEILKIIARKRLADGTEPDEGER